MSREAIAALTDEQRQHWQEPRTVGVIDTVHPDEWNSGLVTEYLRAHQDHPRLANVVPIAGNTLGDYMRRTTGSAPRHFDSGLHRHFNELRPEVSIHENYEASLTERIVADAAKCDVVFEIHGNEEDIDWTLIGTRSSGLVKSLASTLGQFIVINTDVGLTVRNENTVALDLSKNLYGNSPAEQRKNYLRRMVPLIANVAMGFTPSLKHVPLYKECEDGITVEEARKHNLQKRYPKFEPFTDPAVLQLLQDKGLTPRSVPLVWNEDVYGPRTGYVCELIYPVDYEPCATARHCISRMAAAGEIADKFHPVLMPPTRTFTHTGWPTDAPAGHRTTNRQKVL